MTYCDFSCLHTATATQTPASRPLLCLEVNPPRGTEIGPSFEKVSAVADKINFLNVTDSALARMKLACLPFGALLKKEFNREVMVNLACRDRNLIALQADLLAAWVNGVHSIVALTGDAVSVGDSPEVKGVFEVNSVGLLQAIATLNGGKDLAGHSLKGKPNFYPGAVCNPNARNRDVEIRRISKKQAAGAKYILSQPVFDTEVAVGFFEAASKLGIKLFVGLMPLKNRRAIEAIDMVPGIKLGEEFKNAALAKSESEIADFSIQHALGLAKRLGPYVAGYHVISGGYPTLANELVVALDKMLGS